jgi:segregation and condensation protein B
MDETEIKHVLEAALLAAGRPVTLNRLTELFAAKGAELDHATVKRALEALAQDYEGRGIELKEVASGYRVQIRRTVTDWLAPLWEERAPRYTRALLETLALIAYRQPITRGEIEEVRGVVVSTNIVRTLLERNWIRVVGHRDVPGKPAMFGTTREFLDYFGLKRLEDLPTLAEIKDGLPELSPQADLIDSLEAEAMLVEAGEDVPTAIAAVSAEYAGDAGSPGIDQASAPEHARVASSPTERVDLEAEETEEGSVADGPAERASRVVAAFEDPLPDAAGLHDSQTTDEDAVVVPLRKAQSRSDS